MQVVASEPDPVRLRFLLALLSDAGIAAVALDTQVASLGLGFAPVRIAVAAEDAAAARRILADAP